MAWGETFELDGERVSSHIKSKIQEFGISYGVLSEKTGISKSILYGYATGKTKKIPFLNVSKIAHALGITVAELVGWVEMDAHNERINADESELLDYYRKAEQVYQQVAKDILKDHPRK